MSWGELSCVHHNNCPIPNECSFETCNKKCKEYKPEEKEMSEVEVTLEKHNRVRIKDPDEGFIESGSVTNVLLYLILKQLEKFNEHNQRS